MTIVAIVPLPGSVQVAAAFASVAGEAALVRVVRALLGPDRLAAPAVVVATAEPLVARTRSCLDSAGLVAVSVVAAAAPASRHRCLAAGLEHLGHQPGSWSHVLVHDHRHPLAAAEVTDRVISGLRGGHRIVVPILPLTDTVKEVDDRGAVLGTVDRAALRTVQYPRGYERSALAELIASGADELTSALSAGLPIATVAGDGDAFAAELPGDAELLDAIRAVHHPD